MISFRIILFELFLIGVVFKSFSQQPSATEDPAFKKMSSYRLPGGQGHFIEDHNGNLFIVIKGKKGFIGQVKGTMLEPVYKGYVADAERGADGTIWYAGKKNIVSLHPAYADKAGNLTGLFFGSGKAKIFDTNSKLFSRDRFGSIWLNGAPYRVGAGMASIKNPSTGNMTNNYPLPRTNDCFGNMWGLIKNDNDASTIGIITLNDPEKWIIMGKEKGFPEGSWSTVISSSDGIIWVSGESGLCFYDPRKPGNVWKMFPLKGEPVTFLTLSSEGRALVAVKSGEILRVDVTSVDSAMIKPVNNSNLPGSPITALHTDRAGRIWVVAGNNVYCQDMSPSAWESLTPMPYGNHDLSGIEFKGKIYMAGGGALYGYPVVQANFDRLMIYDIKNDRWELSRPMSMNRRYCETGLLDGKIWVIGGFNYNKPFDASRKGWSDTPTNTVEIYDPMTGRWSPGPPLDVPRAETVACTMAGRLYVFGSTGRETFNTLSIGPGETGWRIEPPVPYPVFQTDGCTIDGKAYIMAGGSTGLIMYDPVTKTFHTDLPPVPGTKPTRSSALAAYNGKVWVISGRGPGDGTQVLVYSPSERSWNNGPSFPYPAFWTFGIEVNGDLYVPGGATSSDIRLGYVYWDLFRVMKDQ